MSQPQEQWYTGVGSRLTPLGVLAEMRRIAALMRDDGFILRTGGAAGADSAFAGGVGAVRAQRTAIAKGVLEVYIPAAGWRGWVGHYVYDKIPEDAYRIAENLHPKWSSLDDLVHALHARNVCQILGQEPVRDPRPSSLVICWTGDGAQSARDVCHLTGGTGMAIMLADAYRIPVYNLNNRNARAALRTELQRLKLERSWPSAPGE